MYDCKTPSFASSVVREFHWPHVVANDTDGNMYVGEVDGAARIQKFLRYSATGCSGTGSAEVGKYVQ